MRVLSIVAATLLFVAAPAIAQVAGTSCRATANAFATLETGMSAAQVEKIIGCLGSLLSESEIAGHKTIMLQWDGEGMFGANMNVIIQNGTLQMKSQFGLR